MGYSKSTAAIASDGWDLNHDRVPHPKTCKECGVEVPRTRKRSDAAFGGHGRQREFCSDACRQSHSRRTRAAKLGAAIMEHMPVRLRRHVVRGPQKEMFPTKRKRRRK